MDEVVVRKTGQANLKVREIIYWILGVLETLLAFRLLLKLFGANPKSIFVSIIYSVSQVFVYPFVGIFKPAVSSGIEVQSILEPATVIAMIVYALVVLGIVKLIEISRASRSSTVYRRT